MSCTSYDLYFTNDSQHADAITHSGPFHADECVATAILLMKDFELTLMRTNHVPEWIDEEVDPIVVYDIGGGRFDHHQIGGNGNHSNGVPYASAGLIWEEYGWEAIVRKFGYDSNHERIHQIVEDEFISFIDGWDNGLFYEETAYPMATLSGIVNAMNDLPSCENDAFAAAVEVCYAALNAVIEKAAKRVYAEEVVARAAARARERGLSTLVLDHYLPWQDVESAEGFAVCVYPSQRGGYNWHCRRGFACPPAWCEGNLEQVKAECGLPDDCTFIHRAGFIGACEKRDSAVSMAEAIAEYLDE